MFLQPKEEEESPEKAGKKRKAKRGSTRNRKEKRAKGTTVSPTAAMLPLIKGELRNYQLKGITWLISLWTNGVIHCNTASSVPDDAAVCCCDLLYLALWLVPV